MQLVANYYYRFCRLTSIVSLTLAELYHKKKVRRSERRKSVSIVLNAGPPASTGATTTGSEQGQDREKAGGGSGSGRESSASRTERVPTAAMWESGGKEGYLAWCMVRATQRIWTARQALQGLASSASHQEMTKPLSDKILQDLPDFALLELQVQCKTLQQLGSKAVLLPIESLLPSRQFRPRKVLNWFKVVNYFSRLVQRCYWQKATLHLPDSDWALHYNFTTLSVYAKAKAVYNFLNTHCTAFKPCVMPPLPQLSMLPGGTYSPWTGSMSVHREPHLAAGETEVTVVWCSNPFSPLCGEGAESGHPTSAASEHITGYFAMNTRAVYFPISNEPHTLGVETHIIHTSLRELSELHGNWVELGKLVGVYLDSRALLRPSSRSPSKIRRAEKNMQPPEEVVTGIPRVVKETATFLHSKAKVKLFCGIFQL